MPEFKQFDERIKESLQVQTTSPTAQEHLTAPDKPSLERNIGATIDNRYQLLELIGEGGMGHVYKARQILTGRTVALKMLPRDTNIDSLHMRRFQQEAKAACALNHPHAVGVYEFGIADNGSPYLAMEYVEGTTLTDELIRNKVLDESFAREIFAQVADALEHAHEKRVLHRDIKPSNIMLVADKKLGRKAKLLDFGIAKLEDETQAKLHLTKTGEVFGTPFYMSPEQCQGLKLDSRSDIYSLGCVMYEALCGRPPFTGDNFLQLISKHINDKPEPLGGGAAENPISKSMQSIVHKCLSRNPSDRFQTMAELRHALENLTVVSSSFEQASANPDRKRKRAWLSAAVGAFVLIVVVPLGFPFALLQMATDDVNAGRCNQARRELSQCFPIVKLIPPMRSYFLRTCLRNQNEASNPYGPIAEAIRNAPGTSGNMRYLHEREASYKTVEAAAVWLEGVVELSPDENKEELQRELATLYKQQELEGFVRLDDSIALEQRMIKLYADICSKADASAEDFKEYGSHLQALAICLERENASKQIVSDYFQQSIKQLERATRKFGQLFRTAPNEGDKYEYSGDLGSCYLLTATADAALASLETSQESKNNYYNLADQLFTQADAHVEDRPKSPVYVPWADTLRRWAESVPGNRAELLRRAEKLDAKDADAQRTE